jgi:hypothetical protein
MSTMARKLQRSLMAGMGRKRTSAPSVRNGWKTDISAATLRPMTYRGVIDEPKAGNRLGCLLVLLPMMAFFVVMPDAVHLWSKPWANPLLWLVAGLGSWLCLRWLIDKPLGTLARGTRLLTWGLLLTISLLLAAQIIRSV